MSAMPAEYWNMERRLENGTYPMPPKGENGRMEEAIKLACAVLLDVRRRAWNEAPKPDDEPCYSEHIRAMRPIDAAINALGEWYFEPASVSVCSRGCAYYCERWQQNKGCAKHSSPNKVDSASRNP